MAKWIKVVVFEWWNLAIICEVWGSIPGWGKQGEFFIQEQSMIFLSKLAFQKKPDLIKILDALASVTKIRAVQKKKKNGTG